MISTINTFLFAGDKLKLVIHLRQPILVYSASGLFIKNKSRIQTFKET